MCDVKRISVVCSDCAVVGREVLITTSSTLSKFWLRRWFAGEKRVFVFLTPRSDVSPATSPAKSSELECTTIHAKIRFSPEVTKCSFSLWYKNTGCSRKNAFYVSVCNMWFSVSIFRIQTSVLIYNFWLPVFTFLNLSRENFNNSSFTVIQNCINV